MTTFLYVPSLPRELARRSSGQLDVVLLWNEETGEVVVEVADHADGPSFQVAVPPERALDGFNHPYAYASPSTLRQIGVPAPEGRLHSMRIDH
jgi:hypothetical protein